MSYVFSLHEGLLELLEKVPSCFLKPVIDIVPIEYKNYPFITTTSELVLLEISKLFSDINKINEFRQFLVSSKLRQASDQRRLYAKRMGDVLKDFMRTFRPAETGKYELFQAKEFVDKLTTQYLLSFGFDIVQKKEYKNCGTLTQIKSIQSYSYFLFYKHYMNKDRSIETSDFGDLFSSFYFPYCRILILEKTNHNIMNKNASSNEFYSDCLFYDINFLRNKKYLV